MKAIMRFLLLLEALLCPDRWLKIALFVAPLLSLPLAYVGLELQIKWLTVFAFFLLAPILSIPFVLPLAIRRQFYNRQLQLLAGYRRYCALLSQTGPLLAVLLVGSAMLLGQSLNSHWPALVTLWWALTLYSVLTIRLGLLRTILVAVGVRVALEAWPELQQWLVATWQQPWWLMMLVVSAVGLTVQLALVPAAIVLHGSAGQRSPGKTGGWQAALQRLSVSSAIGSVGSGSTTNSLTQMVTLPGSGNVLSLYRPVLWWVLLLSGLQLTDFLPWPLNAFVTVAACLSIFSQQVQQASSRLAQFWWFGQQPRHRLMASFEQLIGRCWLQLLPGWLALCWVASGSWAAMLPLLGLIAAGQWLLFYLYVASLGQRRTLAGGSMGLTMAALSAAAWLLTDPQLYWLAVAVAVGGLIIRPVAGKVLAGIDLSKLLPQQRQLKEQQYVFFKSGW